MLPIVTKPSPPPPFNKPLSCCMSSKQTYESPVMYIHSCPVLVQDNIIVNFCSFILLYEFYSFPLCLFIFIFVSNQVVWNVVQVQHKPANLLSVTEVTQIYNQQ